jgi:hypothetical protein
MHRLQTFAHRHNTGYEYTKFTGVPGICSSDSPRRTGTMRFTKRFCLLLLASRSRFPSPVGCAEHRYRTYDPYYNDYHRWDDHERVYYNQCVVETHRDPHRDYRKLNKDEQKEYWTWRHNHEERDHDHR